MDKAKLLLGLEKVRTNSQSPLTRQRVQAAEQFIRAFDAWYGMFHEVFNGDFDMMSYDDITKMEELWDEVLITRGLK